jgi:hypothetical protein
MTAAVNGLPSRIAVGNGHNQVLNFAIADCDFCSIRPPVGHRRPANDYSSVTTGCRNQRIERNIIETSLD